MENIMKKKQKKNKKIRKSCVHKEWTKREIILSILLVSLILGIALSALFLSIMQGEKNIAGKGIEFVSNRVEHSTDNRHGEFAGMLFTNAKILIFLAAMYIFIVFIYRTEQVTLVKQHLSEKADIFFLQRKVYHLTIKEAVLRSLLTKVQDEYKEKGCMSKTLYTLRKEHYQTRIDKAKIELSMLKKTLKKKYNVK